jgi:hypothetical protein
MMFFVFRRFVVLLLASARCYGSLKASFRSPCLTMSTVKEKPSI